jgi:class 3 adenylate cyclase/tetratricopeptide (TPR) repeat protein
VSDPATVACHACGHETPSGKKFCIHCGTPVQAPCPACGEPLVPGARFCAECGAARGDSAAPSGSALHAERRLVSVLFADLVGFTTLSEHRDPEEVRELLSRYFERCRAVIERYGGTVEKFIGDAVMAVWGTPVAREDDAERSVRAGLSLTQAVSDLGAELKVRVGVLTGSAAVDLAAEGEGMVLGDTVNTASRLQSIAAPGTVLVDDVTRRASEAAIVYEDAGIHEVKGREHPVHAWSALRVVAGAGGARRSVGLEAPLVGRERELELILAASDATAADVRARLVTIVGEAGSGKSRLLWEFFKYVDGIEEVRWWHQGRCLSYGEGVAFWALAEMVRARSGILEEEEPASARQKLRAAVEQHVPDERERRLVEPRLAHLLGLEQRTAPDRADLFSGWRLFFERMAATEPVILAFEDLQWADSGLLDFIDYMLEWSAEFPIFMLALGRAELLSARPGWTPTITLAPLADEPMAELLRGLVPGLPDELAGQIRRRAEGVPLYAVETVRMLLDRGLLAEEDSRYVVTGDVSDLEVPETLQALAAARLDNLDQAERLLLQDAAVVGQSFTPATLTAVLDRPPAEVQQLLDSLVSKQVLAYVDDSRSGERGQYIFLQALLRQVALSTLSRRDRKARHLAVARQLSDSWGEEPTEIAEVLASHYLAAVEADPEAEDVGAIRASACQTLADAGRRALSLALGPEARRHFERAAEFAEEAAARGALLREAGQAAHLSGELEEALSLLTEAARLMTEAGLDRESAVIDGAAGYVLQVLGRTEDSAALLRRAYTAVDDGSEDEAVADLAARRAAIEYQLGDTDESLRLSDIALRISDGLRLWQVLVRALTSKANSLAELGRPTESTALLSHAVQLALEHDLPVEAASAHFNLADNIMSEGRFAEADQLLDRGIALARRRGDRQGERRLLAQSVLALIALGRWDEALDRVAVVQEGADDIWARQVVPFIPYVLSARGDVAAMGPLLEPLTAWHGWPALEVQAKLGCAMILRETGRAVEALPLAQAAIEADLASAISHVPFEFAEVVDTAFAAGAPAVVEELLKRADTLKPAQMLPLLDAEVSRARARLAADRGQREEAERCFRRATQRLRELGTPFCLARAQLEHAELLARGTGRDDEVAVLRREALAVFEAVGATPWLERARALGTAVAA